MPKNSIQSLANDWIAIDQEKINPGHALQGKRIFYSVFVCPVAFRCTFSDTGRISVYLQYLDSENVTSRAGKYCNFYTGCRSGKIYEININYDNIKAKQHDETIINISPKDICQRVINSEINKIIKDRPRNTAHLDLMQSIIRKYSSEMFKELCDDF